MEVDIRSSLSEEELLALLAWMYYHEENTHAEISEKLHITRVKVTRLLQKARNLGIVKISITKPLPEQYRLAFELMKRFGLRNAIVVKTDTEKEKTLQRIGEAGANILHNTLFDNCRLGLAWSSTVSYMARYLKKEKKSLRVRLNEIAGTYLSPKTPYGISWKVAEILGADLESLPVPALVQSEEVKRAILRDERIQSALNNARKVDLAFVGIGSVQPDSSIVQTEQFTNEELAELRKRGAVGEILMRFFDREGNHVESSQESRIIGLGWQEIRSIPHVVAMAAGREEKGEAILSALKAGVIHSLITDSEAAAYLLKSA